MSTNRVLLFLHPDAEYSRAKRRLSVIRDTLQAIEDRFPHHDGHPVVEFITPGVDDIMDGGGCIRWFFNTPGDGCLSQERLDGIREAVLDELRRFVGQLTEAADTLERGGC